MVKQFSLVLILLTALNASPYDENCLSCHPNAYQLNMFMKKYTIKYSSEQRVKKAIFEYLKEPSFEKSVLPYGFLNRFGIKQSSFLDDKELHEMIDIYYKNFNMRSRIY